MKEYIIKATMAEEPIVGKDKMGGKPTYQPPNPEKIEGFFLMELYNREIDEDTDIICWQFYQDDDFAGALEEVIEIRKGATAYIDGSVKLRRWINEYELELQEYTSEYDGKEVSMIGGNPSKEVLKDCKKHKINYVGVMYKNIIPYDDTGFVLDSVIIGRNKKGKLYCD